jgi:hypothetical protein
MPQGYHGIVDGSEASPLTFEMSTKKWKNKEKAGLMSIRITLNEKTVKLLLMNRTSNHM